MHSCYSYSRCRNRALNNSCMSFFFFFAIFTFHFCGYVWHVKNPFKTGFCGRSTFTLASLWPFPSVRKQGCLLQSPAAAFGNHEKRFTSQSWAPRSHPGANVETFAPVCSSGRAGNSWREWGDESRAIMYREPHCCGCTPAGSLDQKRRRWKGRLTVLINTTGWAALLQPHRCKRAPNGGQGVKSDPGNTSHQPVWREEKPSREDLLSKDNRSGGWKERARSCVCLVCRGQ